MLSFLGLQEIASCPRPVPAATCEAKLPERLPVVTFSMEFKNAWSVYIHVSVFVVRRLSTGASFVEYMSVC